ncbi:hypothetical protein K2173_005279 [Erythroxylum novogranatense]|uniref:Cytochrome P450 n=1 Tax=Erythroxylum novogranatense TaxID=1862640 RepID=A0AAV8TRS6_9ROSI|nr:hypothetical protein K2173_005279 [Erythroxylum novogranatense]
MHKLAEKYGTVMYMRLGSVPTIVVSSPKVAELFLKTHNHVFANRPPLEAAKYLSYDQKGLAFAPYGPYWRNMRKLCTLELLSNHKNNSFNSMRKDEIDLLIESIKQASYERVAVDLSAKVSSVGAYISCRMIFGKKYTDKEFGGKGFTSVIHDGMQLMAVPNLSDYIPQIAPLDLQAREKSSDNEETSKRIGRKGTLNRMVEESDLEGLNYLDMVIKETFRLHPVAPLLIPHMSTEDITLKGFHIPKNSRVFINTWVIGRDPTVWSDAEKFFPERFVGSNIDFRGKDIELLPFGSGRRSCPGMLIGMTTVRLLLARLVHSFDWELPDGMLPSELDMTEVFSLVTPRATPLVAIPIYRLTV